jgi:hypothetical protein
MGLCPGLSRLGRKSLHTELVDGYLSIHRAAEKKSSRKPSCRELVLSAARE